MIEDNNLISISKDGGDARQRNCYAQLEALEEVNAFMEDLHKFWKQKLNNLEEYLDKHGD